MCGMDARQHWEAIYQSKRETEVSWFQPAARLSLELIQQVAPVRTASIIDAGGGASTLVDGLLQAGYSKISVLDISAAALAAARERVGSPASVQWIEANLLEARLPEAAFDVWHDRAVFHFLTDTRDRKRYVEQVERAVRPGGHVLVATFADDGPTKCSGLDVVRYTPESLHGEFGESFRVLHSAREEHVTPAGKTQNFVYCVCRYQRAHVTA
jgi:SAM-dependent methyltransferase